MLDLSLEDQQSRYDRQERIVWWDQERLTQARVLVVGAGALGNEILKSLALLGVGNIHIVDCDTVERSNLARCVLFRECDDGLAKAEIAAEAAHTLNSDVVVVPHVANVMHLGVGLFAEFDVVICGLDSREARVFVNQACRKMGTTWIDGAIEGLRGLARVFPPEGACYECTLGEVDRQILANRTSCALLTTEEMEAGKVPTTATSASLIAAVEVQEAVKILCGREDLVALNNRALVVVGETLDTYVVEYSEDKECLAHEHYESLHESSYVVGESLLDAAARVHAPITDDVVIEMEGDIVLSATCDSCGIDVGTPRRLAVLQQGGGLCDTCGATLRFDLRRCFLASEAAALKLSDLTLADRDVVTVRSGLERQHYVMKREPA